MLLAWVRMLRGELADGGEMLDARDRRGEAAGQRPEPGRAPPQPLAHGALPRATWSSRYARRRRASSSPAGWTTASSRRQPGWHSSAALPRDRRPGPRASPSSSCSSGRAATRYRSCPEEAFARSGSSSSRAAGWRSAARRTPSVRRRAPRARAASMGSLRMATSMADRGRRRASRSPPAMPSAAERALASAAAADEVGVPVEAALSRALAGRALAQAGEPDARDRRARARRERVSCLRRASLPRRSGSRAAAARPPRPSADAARPERRDRRRRADRARGTDRPTRRRPQDES